MIGERLWLLEEVGIFVEIVVQNVYGIREIEIHNWWLWTRKMYWDLGLLPGMPQKWKVFPMGKSRFCAKSGIYFNWIKCLLCHFPCRELFLFFQYVYSTDFGRELNLQIDCIFAFDIKMISNVAHATFCKVFLLYINYAILYILYSIHQKPQYIVSIPIVQ